MPKPKPTCVSLHKLEPGQLADFFALLSERTRSARKDGKPYFSCRFRDDQRAAAFMAWSDGSWFDACEKDWQEGRIYKVRAIYEEHPTYGSQIDIQQIRLATADDCEEGELDPLKFVERSRFDVDEMFAEVRRIAEAEIVDDGLRLLTLALLDRFGPRLRLMPATAKHFHPFAGGWLEHVLSMTRAAMLLADHYAEHYADIEPKLDRDLVVAASLLHEIGRCVEQEQTFGPPSSTIDGQLFGHVILARDVIRDAGREVKTLDPERLRLLEHLVLTHLHLPEWGSPRLPAIPEALLLHHADDLDAKLEMYLRCLRKDKSPGPFTTRDAVLGRPLLKQTAVTGGPDR
ncbi:MAG: HD domain-containing protein [Gemmataceae bacterium]